MDNNVLKTNKTPAILTSAYRYATAQELVSHDIHNNTYNYKNTFSVEIVPVCKDNVVCMPPKLAQQMGNLGQLCVVYRVTQSVHVIDPNTCQGECVSYLCFCEKLLTHCKWAVIEDFWKTVEATYMSSNRGLLGKLLTRHL